MQTTPRPFTHLYLCCYYLYLSCQLPSPGQRQQPSNFSIWGSLQAYATAPSKPQSQELTLVRVCFWLTLHIGCGSAPCIFFTQGSRLEEKLLFGTHCSPGQEKRIMEKLQKWLLELPFRCGIDYSARTLLVKGSDKVKIPRGKKVYSFTGRTEK